MITTNNKFNTMPEQVQENMDNIKKLDEVVSKLNLGTFKAKNIWTNENPSISFEMQAVTNEEYLNPYNILKIYFINNITSELTVQSVMFDIDVNYPIEISYITGTKKHYRKVEFNSINNEIIFGMEQILDLLTGEVEEGSNNYIVPLGIIGFVEEVVL